MEQQEKHVYCSGNQLNDIFFLSYTTDKFPAEYIPTVFENYTTQTNIKGRSVNL